MKLFESTTQQHIEFMVYCGAFLHVRSECSALRMIIFNLEIRHFNVDLLFNAEIVVLRKVASLWLWKATANLIANCLELSYFNKYSTEKKKLNEFLLRILSYNPLSMISTLFPVSIKKVRVALRFISQYENYCYDVGWTSLVLIVIRTSYRKKEQWDAF